MTQPNYFSGVDFAAMRPRWWELLAARIFGKRITTSDETIVLRCARWRGKLYVLDVRHAPSNSK